MTTVAAKAGVVERIAAALQDEILGGRPPAGEKLESEWALVALLVVNTIARALAAHPSIASALYARPETNEAGLQAALAAIEAGDASFADAAVAVLAELDAATLERLAGR